MKRNNNKNRDQVLYYGYVIIQDLILKILPMNISETDLKK